MTIVSISYDQNLTEKYVQSELVKLLAKYTKVETEVKTTLGRIDILTDNLIIEVKRHSKWKQAIGQLASYRTEYPKKKAVAFYFGVSGWIDNPEFQLVRKAHQSASVISYHHCKEFTDFLCFLKKYSQDPLLKDVPFSSLRQGKFK